MGTGVTEAREGKAGLGTQRAGRGRSLPPTPDALPALSAPTYPRERPAGDIPLSPPPLPSVRRAEFHNHAQVHKDAGKRAERLNSSAEPAARPQASGRRTCEC